MDIFNLCLANSIVLEAQWIPRSLNERADLLSRFIDKDDWSINPSVFRLVDAKWALTQLIAFRPITMPSFRGSTLNLLPQVAAVWTPWPRIGDMRITGFALRWVPLCLQLGLSRPAPVTAL